MDIRKRLRDLPCAERIVSMREMLEELALAPIRIIRGDEEEKLGEWCRTFEIRIGARRHLVTVTSKFVLELHGVPAELYLSEAVERLRPLITDHRIGVAYEGPGVPHPVGSVESP